MNSHEKLILITFIVVGIVVSVIAVLAVNLPTWCARSRNVISQIDAGPSVRVVETTVAIKRGQIITSDMVHEGLADIYKPGEYGDKSLVVGRRAKGDMPAKLIIMEGDLGDGELPKVMATHPGYC